MISSPVACFAPKTAWLLRFEPVFRTGRTGFRGLPLRTPTARSMHHTRAAQWMRWQAKRARAFSGFELLEDSLARHTPVAEVLRTGWHAWRSRCLPGVLVRRRSTSAMSPLRDDRARVGATPSARPGRRSEASLRAQAPESFLSRYGARGRPRENTTGYERGRRGGPSSAAGGSSVAAPPRKYRSCSFMLGPRPPHGGIGPSYPSYGGRGVRNGLKAKKRCSAP